MHDVVLTRRSPPPEPGNATLPIPDLPLELTLVGMEECPYFGAGSFFTGVVGGGRQHGKGRCEYASGDVYEGEWAAGQRHGKGEYRDHRGGLFIGKFKQNHPWEGTMEQFVYENGDSYHGTWAQGMQEQGAFKRADGHGFVGKFVNNLPFEGVYTRPHTESTPATPALSVSDIDTDSKRSQGPPAPVSYGSRPSSRASK